jgi:hypothetical protein
MDPTSSTTSEKNPADNLPATDYYCPRCRQPVGDPLACGDCASLICRRCGTPLEQVDELGIG